MQPETDIVGEKSMLYRSRRLTPAKIWVLSLKLCCYKDFLFQRTISELFLMIRKKNLLKYNVKESRLIWTENVFNEDLLRSITLTIKARILLQFYEVAISQIIMN